MIFTLSSILGFLLPTFLGGNQLVAALAVKNEQLHPGAPPVVMSSRNVNDNPTSLLCGLFTTANKDSVKDLLNDLSGRSSSCDTPAKTCRRHACKNKSGVFVCNDTNQQISLNCKTTVAYYAQNSLDLCCTGGDTAVSGQQFSDGNFNVIVAAADCSTGEDTYRPSKGPSSDPWGPNGECVGP
ncbi:hypothetical protein B0T17DRAFT_511058 [Bombardia bombarda]|uniref:Uncharacterized protein n=1 Tax=Bombardia bombarda TaxID=252184 RepID=A0AA39WH47_9PEZI|nr:hypothetical protein B0T17DRAFT_511058 [Bombardia bombarda]